MLGFELAGRHGTQAGCPDRNRSERGGKPASEHAQFRVRRTGRTFQQSAPTRRDWGVLRFIGERGSKAGPDSSFQIHAAPTRRL
jgi:hypothetical protein